ncbi:MAG: hypothetical protein IKF11_02715 [Methanobrevibacter sp.]|nr:hypothetical protein [Methanobrevibacter sp.]
MDSNKKTLEEKLNFINDAKKTNIAKIHIESVKMGRVNVHPVILKKHYEFGIH